MARKLKTNTDEIILHFEKRIGQMSQRRLTKFPKWTRRDLIFMQILLHELQEANVISKEILVEDE